MGEIYAEPAITLHGKDELLAYLSEHPDYKDHKWDTTSDFIEGVIDDIVLQGKYPYNSDVEREVEKRLEIPQQPDNGSVLSTLVYNAQKYRRSAQLKRDGFVYLTQEIIDQAYEMGAKIEMEGYNILFSPVRVLYNVRKIGDKVYMMKPHARKYAVSFLGQIGKIVKG